MHELRGDDEPDLKNLLSLMTPVDLVIVEGFKSEAYPKIEIHRVENGKAFLHPEDTMIVAVASDCPERITDRPSFDLAAIEAIADFIVAHAKPVEEVMGALTRS